MAPPSQQCQRLPNRASLHTTYTLANCSKNAGLSPFRLYRAEWVELPLKTTMRKKVSES
jgi:hypothetical protein